MIIGLNGSSEAIKALYLSHKAARPKFSLEYICRKAGISSKGYLSDVIKGRRTIHPKYIKGILRAFSLSELEAEYLKLLIQRDHENDTKTLQKMDARLKELEREAKTRKLSLPQSFVHPFFTLEVFCAFGLFNGEPTLNDLVEYFGSASKAKVKLSLDNLEHMGSIRLADNNQYVLLERQFLFDNSEDGYGHYAHLEESIDQAKANVRHFFPKNDVSFFESTTASVSMEDFIKAIPKIKRSFRKSITELETENGDELVRFNIQIYPRNKDK